MDSILAVSFDLLYKCNARCAHCFNSSGPDRTEEMPVEDVLRWIDQIAPMDQITWISFLGGEPFLYKGLNEVTRKAKEYNKKIKIYTNCFWASDLATAKQRLQELMPEMLVVSADEYHQKCVPLENVKNALRAALELGGVNVVACMSGFNSGGIRTSLIDEFGAGLDINQLAYIEPIGRAAGILRQPGHNNTITEIINSPCEMGGKVVHVNVDGSCYACCRPIATYSNGSPFLIGNAYESSLRTIIEHADPSLAIPQKEPLRDLLTVVCWLGLGDRLKRDYASCCDLCQHLMSDEPMRRAIEAFYH